MGKPAFGKLSNLWSEDSRAADLIVGWDRAARKWVEWYHKFYYHPCIDWEPIIYDALYEAAFTYDESKAKFLTWLAWSVRNKTSSYKRKAARRSKRLHQVMYDDLKVDGRYFYDDRRSEAQEDVV